MTETDLLAETLHEGGDQELECSLGVEPSKNRITNTLTKRNFTTTIFLTNDGILNWFRSLNQHLDELELEPSQK